jgi:polynucleotide 5'-kinase involved in rRNA processing
MEGCISLTSGNTSKKIWIGEFSPLNNLQTYLRGIRYLFKHYRDIWFTKKLIVNTMGYTTGLGEFLIYEIYQIIQPKSIIVLQLPNPTSDSLKNIVHNIKTGSYISKLYMNTT